VVNQESGQRPVVRAVEVHDPQVRVVPVGHDVGKLPDVDDSLSVRRNLRVGGPLEIEDVGGGEHVGGLGCERRPFG